MRELFNPGGRIPIGFANISGTRVPVEIDNEWMRFFTTIVERLGIVAPSVQEAYDNNYAHIIQEDDGSGGSSDSDEMISVPGPKGDTGPRGEPGATIFLMDEEEEENFNWPRL